MTSLTDALKTVLADSYTLYLKTQNYHWNVEGEQFAALHAMFETHYTDLATAVDEIAERIRALGEYAPGSFSSFAKLATIAEAKDGLDQYAMVEDLYGSHRQMLASLKQALEAAKAEEDEVSLGMIAARMEIHEKTAWMLRSTLPASMKKDAEKAA